MASKFPGERDEKVKLRTKKGHDMTWSCDKHGEPIEFYCKQHGIPICLPCATKDHQKPCELNDIEDVILERRRKLDDKQQEIEEVKKQVKALDSKLESTAISASKHFQSVNDELKVAFEKRERWIKSSQAKVESETKAISEVVAKKIKDLTSRNQHAISTMDNVDAKIKRIKQDDKTLVNEAPQVLASLNDNLCVNVHQDVSNCLERIRSEVQRVKFVEGDVGGEHYGRIDGYIGKWKLVESIHIPLIVDDPRVCGLISDDEICVSDDKNDTTYVTHITTKHTQKVIEGDSNVSITTNGDKIVCGKGRRGCTDDTALSGCITVYDRQWMAICNITILRGNCYDHTRVYVDVDRDRMILAAECDQSRIHVINPCNGNIVNVITMKDKMVKGEIQALSSGDIVVGTGDNEFTVISQSGAEKAVIHCAEWFMSECRVDKLTDTVYITYWDNEHTIYAVDQVSCDGIIQARRIVEYETSVRYSVNNACIVTPSGNLVACDGKSLLVYKKSFILGTTEAEKKYYANLPEKVQSDGTDSVEPIVHALDGTSVTGKFGALGGKLSTRSHGFTLHIPPGALEEDEEISLNVLTAIPQDLTLREDELLVSHGFQCYPSGLRFKKPLKLIIPHCALVTAPNKVQTVLYSLNQSGTPKRLPHSLNIICSVQERWLEVSISHFSGGFIALVWDWIFLKGILLSCMPFLPRVLTSRKPLLEVRFIKMPHDQNPNYGHALTGGRTYQPAKDVSDYVVFRRSTLTVSCQLGDTSPATCAIQHNDMDLKPMQTVYFELDLTDESDETLVTLKLIQTTTETIKFKTRFQEQETPSPTPVEIDTVSDEKLNTLAAHFPHDKYHELSDKLGIEYNEASRILIKHGSDSKLAIRECLSIWKNRKARSFAELKRIFDSVDLGGIWTTYME